MGDDKFSFESMYIMNVLLYSKRFLIVNTVELHNRTRVATS